MVSAIGTRPLASATISVGPAPVSTAADTGSADASSATPGDSVTVSDAAQQALANATSDANTTGNGADMSNPQVAAFYSNAAILTDTSGKYSQDDQLNAYVNLWNMMEAGWPAGLGSDAGQVQTDAMENSQFGQLVQQLSNGYTRAGASTFDLNSTNNAQMSAQASLNYVNGLSDFDKKVLFETNVNATMANGKGSWQTSVDQWIGSLQDTANGTAPNTSGAASMPVGLSDQQKADVAAIIGTNSSTNTNAPSGNAAASNGGAASATTSLSATPVDARTALDQGVAKILTSDSANSARNAKSDGPSRPESLAQMIADMNATTVTQTFVASPKQGAASGSQVNQNA